MIDYYIKIILESKNNPLFSKNNGCTFWEKRFRIIAIIENKIAKAQWLSDHRAFAYFLRRILKREDIVMTHGNILSSAD